MSIFYDFYKSSDNEKIQNKTRVIKKLAVRQEE